MHRILPLVVLLMAPLACVSGTADSSDDGMDLEADSAHPPNHPAGYDRVRARITCADARLRYRPGPDTEGNRVVGAADSLLHAGRYVMVQGRVGSRAAPGNLDGFVWINPDESLSNVPEAERSGYEARHPDIGHRGWVPDGCLAPTSSEDAPIPTPSNSDATPSGDAMPWGGTGKEMVVKHACVVDGTYSGVRADLRDSTFHYAPYGTKGSGDAIPLSFSTTSVEGGGTIFGYVFGGQTVHVVYAQGKADANQTSGSTLARWSYVYGDSNGRKTYGWLWSACLEAPSGPAAPAPAPAPAPEPPAPGGVTGAECWFRCCDGSLHRVSAGSESACRGAYAVCTSHGLSLRIKYGATYIYDKGHC